MAEIKWHFQHLSLLLLPSAHALMKVAPIGANPCSIAFARVSVSEGEDGSGVTKFPSAFHDSTSRKSIPYNVARLRARGRGRHSEDGEVSEGERARKNKSTLAVLSFKMIRAVE